MVLTFACSFGCSSKSNDKAPEQVIVLPDSSDVSVFELLMAHHNVEYKESSAGVFVTAIDSVAGTSSSYWLYFINDTAGTVASDKYMLHGGERVEWKLISGY